MKSILLCCCSLMLAAAVFAASPVAAATPEPTVMNVAHRGASGLAPENTLPAFEIAFQRCAAPMIELDVHLSRDGVPVIIHDDTLERTTNAVDLFPDRKPWRVVDFTFAELQKLDAGSWYVKKDPFGRIAAGEIPQADVSLFSSGKVRIPTLLSVLSLVRVYGGKVNIEIKNFPIYYPGLIEKVLEDVRRTKLEDRVIISSFDHECLAVAKKLAPEILRGALVDQPLFPLKEYLVDQLGAFSFNAGADVLGRDSVEYARTGRLREDLFKQAKDAGLQVYVWTVDDPQLMKTFIDAGISGIFTNFPNRLAKVLAERTK